MNEERLVEEMIIVGVYNKRLEEFCYSVNNIRPLHICQSIACNMTNYKTAVKRGDKEWQSELIEERIELYTEARIKFDLNMARVNDFMWNEYKHQLTEHKFLDVSYPELTQSELDEIRYCDLSEKAQHEPLTDTEQEEIKKLQEKMNITPCDNCEGQGGKYFPSMGDSYCTEWLDCLKCGGHGELGYSDTLKRHMDLMKEEDEDFDY